VRTIDAGDSEVLRTTLAARRDSAGMSVGEVALAVDAGREIAARAAADGLQLLVATAPADRDDTAARAVAAALTGGSEHGPLGVLRRLGDATTAVLCGVALGAGEHGLGCVCDGLAALAGAAVAAGIEPDLRARLAAAPATASAPLAAHLGVPVVAP
jgi:NaMN:DMB phosphoribosyltransferase